MGNIFSSSDRPRYALVLLDINGCTVAGVPLNEISFPNYKSAITSIENGTERFIVEILDITDDKEKLLKAEKKWSEGIRAKAIDAEIEKRKTLRQKEHRFICVWPEWKNKPNGGIRLGNIEVFKDFIQRGAHIAVYRPSFDYYHHYLIIDQECDEKSHYINIIHYTSVVKTRLGGLSGGKIKKKKVELRQSNKDFFDFEAGVYLIQKKGYPTTEEQAEKVIERALKRLGESKYSVASNNCESFATWASTGKAECDQMKNASTLERLIIDALDVMHITLLEKLTEFILSTLGKILFKTGIHIPDKAGVIIVAIIAKLKSLLPSIFTEATTSLSKDAISSISSEVATSIASEITETVSVSSITSESAKRIASKITAIIPGSASKIANIGKTCALGAFITLFIEVVALALQIYKLYKQKKQNQQDDEQFKREIVKACTGSMSSVIFTAIGTAVGMALSPHILCVAVGGLIGGILGKVFGLSIAGLIHDTIINELHETPALA